MPFKPLLRAFPSVLVRDSKGMLLRDYFASGIASGYVRFMGCDPDARGQICDLQNADNNAEAIARSAYKIADAMLRVREEKQEAQEETVPPGTLIETGGEE
jgi:hypothetical protein